MDAREFIPIAKTLQRRWWAFPIPPGALDGYVQDLADVPAEKVAAAVDVLATEGLDRPPTSGQIRRRVAELDLDIPSWDEARLALVRWRRDRPRRDEVKASWRCPAGVCDGSSFVAMEDRARTMRPCACRPAYMEAIRGWGLLPAIVGEFVREGHVMPAELDRMLDQGDTTSEAQVRARWQQFTRRATDSRVFADLPAGDVARIVAARREDHDRHGGGLRRLDTSATVALLERGAA